MVKSHFDSNFEPAPQTQPLATQTYLLRGEGDSVSWKIGLAKCADMGNMHAAAQTGISLALFRPGLVIFAGTAATIKSEILQGDIVMPRTAYGRYHDKISGKESKEFKHLANEGGFQEYFFTRGKNRLSQWWHGFESVLAKRTAEKEITAYADSLRSGYASHFEKNTQLKSAMESPPKSGRVPKLHAVEQIYCSQWVLDSKGFRDFLVGLLDRKASAVDMESLGFLTTLNAFRELSQDFLLDGVVIRGISDAAAMKGPNFDGNLAMKNVALTLVDFINYARNARIPKKQ